MSELISRLAALRSTSSSASSSDSFTSTSGWAGMSTSSRRRFDLFLHGGARRQAARAASDGSEPRRLPQATDAAATRGTILASADLRRHRSSPMRPFRSLLLAAAAARAYRRAGPAARHRRACSPARPRRCATFAMLDGVVARPGDGDQPDGSRLAFIQTERIGPFLGGSIKVIEGAATTTTARSASTPSASSPSIRRREPTRCARTRRATSATSPSCRPATATAGRSAAGRPTIRYVATVKDGELHEVGEPSSWPRAGADLRDAAQAHRPTDWPAAGAVPPK